MESTSSQLRFMGWLPFEARISALACLLALTAMSTIRIMRKDSGQEGKRRGRVGGGGGGGGRKNSKEGKKEQVGVKTHDSKSESFISRFNRATPVIRGTWHRAGRCNQACAIMLGPCHGLTSCPLSKSSYWPLTLNSTGCPT